VNPAILAIAIAIISYALVILDRFDRSLIAIIGGCAMIALGILTQEQAIEGIDFNTIALLTGMMIMVGVSRRSGLFEYLAIASARSVGASPAGILVAFQIVTALASALLDNVTTVLLIAPVTLAITRRLGSKPFPYLCAVVMASNIGGTATLIGDPPNIIIGSAADLGFNAFILHLTPVIAVVLAAQLALVHAVFGRQLHATAEARTAIMGLVAREEIIDRLLLWQSLAVLGLVILGFVLADHVGMKPGTIAVLGAAVLMLLESHGHYEHHRTKRVTESYGTVDWITIFFFVGLFVIVHALEVTGIMRALAAGLLDVTGGSLAATAYVVLWASAVLSAVVDNIPFVAAMIPVIKSLGVSGDAALPLWWSLSLGACLGGNATLVGASANLTVAGIAGREGVRFTFLDYTRYAAPLTLVHVAICHGYLWLRYF
jgi:Na+/H+ antiporter NhaD/arsenite permease-like protein